MIIWLKGERIALHISVWKKVGRFLPVQKQAGVNLHITSTKIELKQL